MTELVSSSSSIEPSSSSSSSSSNASASSSSTNELTSISSLNASSSSSSIANNKLPVQQVSSMDRVHLINFADDFNIEGPIPVILQVAEEEVFRKAPLYGLRLNGTKTNIIVLDVEKTKEISEVAALNPAFRDARISTGGVILGCYIGDEGGTSAFIDKKVRKWASEMEGVIEAGNKDPHGLYTAVTRSILHKPTYTQRGVGGTAEQYKPIEDLICNKFLPSIMGRTTREIQEDDS